MGNVIVHHPPREKMNTTGAIPLLPSLYQYGMTGKRPASAFRYFFRISEGQTETHVDSPTSHTISRSAARVLRLREKFRFACGWGAQFCWPYADGVALNAT